LKSHPRHRAPRWPFLLALSLCVGCSFGKSFNVAGAAVRRYHDQYNAGLYREIYQQSDEAFKKGAGEQAMTELLSAVDRKLGKVTGSKQVGFHANWNPEGTFVNLTYESTFEQGKAFEQFVWRVSGDEAKLVSYNINSPDLITK
jgi:hypothetical protein